MLNTLFIGPSGIGKTTALELGIRDLMGFVPPAERPQVIEGAPTPEKLHEDLAAQPHTILYAEELASYFNKQKYMEALLPYVTEMLNYKPTMERRTRSGGIITVANPSGIVLGGSTKEWLQKQLPDAALSGGFLARFLIVCEEHKRQRVPLPSRALDSRGKLALGRHRFLSAQRFLELIHQPQGEIKWKDYYASDTYGQWYTNHQPASGHLAPFAARAGEFVQRLAMLTAISCGRSYITASDITCGVELYTYATKRLQSVVVPYSRDGEMLNKVLECIGTGSKDVTTLRRLMRNSSSASEVDRLVDSLVRSGDVVVEESRVRRTNAGNS